MGGCGGEAGGYGRDRAGGTPGIGEGGRYGAGQETWLLEECRWVLFGGWETLCLPLLPCQDLATGAQRPELTPGGGVTPSSASPAGLGGAWTPPISFPEALQHFQATDLSECRVRQGPALPASRWGGSSSKSARGGSAAGEDPRSLPHPSLSIATWLCCVPSPSSHLAHPVPFPTMPGPHRGLGGFDFLFFPPRRKSGWQQQRGGATAWPRYSATSAGPPGSSHSCRASGSWRWPWHSVSGPAAGLGGSGSSPDPLPVCRGGPWAVRGVFWGWEGHFLGVGWVWAGRGGFLATKGCFLGCEVCFLVSRGGLEL